MIDNFPDLRKIVDDDTATIEHYNVGKEVRMVIEKIRGTMPEDLQKPEKSIQEIERADNGIGVTEIINSVKGLIGNINKFSLRDVIQYSIERCDMAKKLFEYESSTISETGGTVLDVFLSKAKGHRDWLSHITPQAKRFDREQLSFATDKLKLLFRLSLMYDIGMEIKEESLNNRINEINQWYSSQSLV